MKVPCGVSVRHVHLCQADIEALFGQGAQLEFERALLQPGQYLCKQRVNLVGPKRVIENVAVLGPARKESQVEIARTDAFTLGLKDVPVRQSGNINDTPGLTLSSGDNAVVLKNGVIIAKRHVHLDSKTAKENNLADGEIVNLVFDGERGGVFGETVVRVSENFLPEAHLDSDEGNAVFAGNLVEIKKLSEK